MPTTTSIIFKVEAPNTGWVGFGFGTGMTNTDMFVITPSGGSGTITDRYSTGRSTPGLDTTNDYTMTTVASGSTNIYTVTRNLNTGDLNDYVIKDGETKMIYAYGTGTALSYHGEGNYGTLKLTVDSANRSVAVEGGAYEYNTDNALVHGLLLYIAWSWLSFILIITGRYSKYFYVFRMYIHSIVGIVVLVMTLIAVSGYGSSDRPRPSLNKLGDSHTGLGSIVLYWTIGVVVIGIFTKLAFVFLRHLTFLPLLARYAHILLSWLLIVYSQITMLSGLYFFDSPVTYLFYIHLGCMCLLLVMIELVFCITIRRKYVYVHDLDKKGLPEMTIEEFQKSDKKLALFDNYVVNMGGYVFEHPGGRYVLLECVGKDIGKFFYGAYSMENQVKAHTHSYIAGKILKKLICAKLAHTPNSKKLFLSRDESNIREGVHEKQHAIYGSDLVFSVIDKKELLKGVYRVKFANDRTRVKIFNPGLEMLGRHYLISSLQNKVLRYYTICN